MTRPESGQGSGEAQLPAVPPGGLLAAPLPRSTMAVSRMPARASRLKGFPDVVEGTPSQQLPSGRLVQYPGHHDDGNRGVVSAQDLQHVDRQHPRHQDVEEHDIRLIDGRQT